MRTIAVYDTETGAIRQVVRCLEEDMDKQHSRFPGHHWVEVEEDTSPREHAVDTKSLARVSRDRSEDEAAESERQQRYRKADKITGGFLSRAIGHYRYGSSIHDQLNMLAVAQVGGDLMCSHDDGKTWGPLYHTREQGLQVLEDFSRHRDGARHLLS